jgi:hypothetical protein
MQDFYCHTSVEFFFKPFKKLIMKKTIYVTLMAFLLLLGCSKSANDLTANQDENQLQSAKNVQPSVDRTVLMPPYKETYPSGKLTLIPVMCDGVIIDHLTGSLDVLCRMFGHFHPDWPEGTPGDLNHFQSQWMIHSYSGTLTSTSGSGEVFDVQGTKKMDVIGKVFTFHLNINGNQGNHYIVSASGTNAANSLGYTFTIERAVCPGSSD